MENLRFLLIYFNHDTYDIKLDVTETAPENLHVFHIGTQTRDNQIYSMRLEDMERVNQVKEKLIHNLVLRNDEKETNEEDNREEYS